MGDITTLEELLSKQAADGEFQAAAQTVGHLALCYSYNYAGILVQKAPIYGELQKAVPATLCARILYL